MITHYSRRFRSACVAGMSTIEYAVGTVAAAALAGVLYKIVTGGSVTGALTNLITGALNDAP